jgi:hypothetical protein
MKKIVKKGLTALSIVFLFGTLLASCGPIFDVGDGVNGNGGNGGNGGDNPPPPSQSGYTTVTVTDVIDLVDYLTSEDTSYAITLNTEDNDIYLTKNVSIVKPMRIIGSSGGEDTIHSTSRAGGTTYYSLDLQADLELENCSFTGYNATSTGSPPLNISAGKTLTLIGTDSVLELRNVGSGAATSTGSQVRLVSGASISDESGDLLFKSGVEKLIISGSTSLSKKLTVGEGAILQIESGGELRVGSGATLTLDNDLKELRLNGNIVVDRTASPEGVLAVTGSLDSLLTKITGGNGSITIDNDIAGTTAPFQYGVNTIIKLSSDGISLGKKVSSGLGGVINTTTNITIPKDKKLIVGAGVEFTINKELILAGGTLDVSGNVTVTTGGQITLNAVDNFNGIPKGIVLINSNGIITIDDGGTFKDESVTWDAKIFTFPAYGAGSLIIKGTESTGGKAVIGTETGKVIIGSSTDALLKFGASPVSSLTIKTGPAFTLAGTGTLNATGDLALGGSFNIAVGAVLTVDGGTLTVKAPNQLTGITTPEAVQLIINSGKVAYYTAANNIVDEFGEGSYKWGGPSALWDK